MNKHCSNCVEAGAGADVNYTCFKWVNSTTVLTKAAYEGDISCLESLIRAGADVNMTWCFGESALTVAPAAQY